MVFSNVTMPASVLGGKNSNENTRRWGRSNRLLIFMVRGGGLPPSRRSPRAARGRRALARRGGVVMAAVAVLAVAVVARGPVGQTLQPLQREVGLDGDRLALALRRLEH